MGFTQGAGAAGYVVCKFDIPITEVHLRTLGHGQWLNDEGNNFWMGMLMERDERLYQSGKLPKRTLLHNTIFASKLTEGRYNYDNVKRWTTPRALMAKCGVEDIFELSRIVIPVNVSGQHWCLAVIDIAQKQVQYYDSFHASGKGGGSGRRMQNKLLRYLTDEMSDKIGGAVLDRGKWTLPGAPPGTPQQQNGFDCGMFTCMFAECLGVGARLSFAQGDMGLLRDLVESCIRSGGIGGSVDVRGSPTPVAAALPSARGGFVEEL
jgi:sentrin-specific protease 1